MRIEVVERVGIALVCVRSSVRVGVVRWALRGLSASLPKWIACPTPLSATTVLHPDPGHSSRGNQRHGVWATPLGHADPGRAAEAGHQRRRPHRTASSHLRRAACTAKAAAIAPAPHVDLAVASFAFTVGFYARHAVLLTKGDLHNLCTATPSTHASTGAQASTHPRVRACGAQRLGQPNAPCV